MPDESDLDAQPSRAVTVLPRPAERLTYSVVLVPCFRAEIRGRGLTFPDDAPALLNRLQRRWQIRHREVRADLLARSIDGTFWIPRGPAMSACPPTGGRFDPPYLGQPCDAAGCPWCAARDAFLTYRAIHAAFFPPTPDGGRDRLIGASLWVRELVDRVPAYTTVDGVARNGLVDSVYSRSRAGGDRPRTAEYRRLNPRRTGQFGFFERILPVYRRREAVWSILYRQLILLPTGAELPEPPFFDIDQVRGPYPDPTPSRLLREVAWAHRYNPQVLHGRSEQLVDLSMARHFGLIQMTAGMFRDIEPHLRLRRLSPPPRRRGQPREDP